MAHPKIYDNSSQEKTQERTQSQQQPPYSSPNDNNPNHRCLPNTTLILLLVHYIPGSTHNLQLALYSRRSIWLIWTSQIIKMSRGWPSPPSKPNFTMEAIHWARMAVKKDLNTTTVIVCHHKAHHLTTIHDEMHIITTIPPHNIEYDPIFKWPKYLHQYDNIYTSILCIHNQRTLTKESTNNQQSHTTY